MDGSHVFPAEPTVDHVHYGRCSRVIDGDTFIAMVDLDFETHRKVTIRLRGIDVYERNTVMGKEAIAWLKSLMMPGSERPENYPRLTILSYKDTQSFARWVCDVWIQGDHLAEFLRAAGYEKT